MSNIGKTIVFTQEMYEKQMDIRKSFGYERTGWTDMVGKIFEIKRQWDDVNGKKTYELSDDNWVYQDAVDKFLDDKIVIDGIELTKGDPVFITGDGLTNLYEWNDLRLFHGYVKVGDYIEYNSALSSGGGYIVDVKRDGFLIKRDSGTTFLHTTGDVCGVICRKVLRVPETGNIFSKLLFHNHKLMNNVVQFGRDLFMSKESKLLRDFGLEDPENVPTEEGRELLMDILWRENRDKVIEIAQKMQEEKK